MEISMFTLIKVLGSIAVVAMVSSVVHWYTATWLKCERLRKKLRRQGVRGPAPSFLYGNLPEMQRIQMKAKAAIDEAALPHGEFIAHDYTSSLFPYFEQWRKEYGLMYTYSNGMRQHLYINQAELVKEMNQCVTLLGKPSYVSKRLKPMLGNGIIRSNGHFWSQQRKIIAPEFFMEKVKGMVGLMVESAQTLLRTWDSRIEAEGGQMAEITVDEDLRSLSADVISRACFGSSYVKGKEVFSKLRSLQNIMSRQSFLFGNSLFGFLPSKDGKEVRNLEKEIELLIWKAIQERRRECSERTSGKDLMQLILEGAINDHNLDKESSKNFIVDNCKNIYFAGHETTAVAASWCLMLLALHPKWQSQIREEVAQVCENNTVNADALLQLKAVTMVIQETLRLYPPAAFVSREALEDTKIGNVNVPKNVCIWTLIPTLHRDPEIWGMDANEFKPQRFADGISKACKYPQAYVPFGLGPRLCLGKNFAMVQLKIILSLIVSRYTFSLSPKYQHAPTYQMIVGPKHGVRITIQKI
ncbi:hypothetical protein BT93_J0722 [Corymbia citriodora subsp. variegata]|nr:hypothetical protein BT93_J0722 [Corymbia citriodora subsp. variegata]